MGWSYDFWVGNFYPEGTNSSDYLTEYSRHFDTVEVDSTFYRIPSEETVVKWRNQTPLGFFFSAKFPQVITHMKMLKNCEMETERFIKRISGLGKKLGPLLLQFPSMFGEEHISILSAFVSSLPDGYRFVVEVRNRKMLGNKLVSLLRDNGVALAFVDSPFMPETMEVTADFVYVRWEGNRRKVKGTVGRVEVDRTEDIKKWAEKIGRLADGSNEVFGYFSKYYSGDPPADAKQLLNLLNLG
jgi:uncharacterized protein YecE (DUF72 family)